ncbi:MAG: hypothetical protein ACRC9T_03835 [Vibrionaceae bacterium]
MNFAQVLSYENKRFLINAMQNKLILAPSWLKNRSHMAIACTGRLRDNHAKF